MCVDVDVGGGFTSNIFEIEIEASCRVVLYNTRVGLLVDKECTGSTTLILRTKCSSTLLFTGKIYTYLSVELHIGDGVALHLNF